MKKNNLPPIALQCEHPDSCFYMVGVGENSVSGYFDGVIWNGRNWENHPGQAWEIDFDTFIEARQEVNLITDYERGRVWFAIEPDGSQGIDAREWAAFWLSENDRSSDFHAVLSAAIQADFRAELNRMESAAGALSGQSRKTWPELLAVLANAEVGQTLSELSEVCQAVRDHAAQPDAAAKSRREMHDSIDA